jgi:hypothetical protein
MEVNVTTVDRTGELGKNIRHANDFLHNRRWKGRLCVLWAEHRDDRLHRAHVAHDGLGLGYRREDCLESHARDPALMT